MTPLDDTVLDLMRRTAEKIIMPRYRNLRAGEVQDKGADDLVTIADREAEDMLSEELAQIAPGLAIVGEEAAFSDPEIMDRLSGPCWIIDPIDGTGNFAKGVGHFAIMIARADGGNATSGWIYDPQRKRLCHAHHGSGAFMDGSRIFARSSGTAPPRLAAMTRYMHPDQRSVFETEIAPHYEIVDAPGCAAEQYPLVASGDHDITIYERTLPWDHAAGALFLNEAGGVCLRPNATPYTVDSGRKGMIGAADRRLFDDLAERLLAAGIMPAAG